MYLVSGSLSFQPSTSAKLSSIGVKTSGPSIQTSPTTFAPITLKPGLSPLLNPSAPSSGLSSNTIIVAGGAAALLLLFLAFRK